MKKNYWSFQSLVAFCLIFSAFTCFAQTQIYTYSGPLSGSVDVALGPRDGDGGYFTANFESITETFYVNSTANTVEAEGSITVSPFSGSFSMGPGVFNPGQSGLASLTVGNNGTFSFDLVSSLVNGYGMNLPVPVSGSGEYNGQPFSGSWNMELPIYQKYTSVTPGTLTFSADNTEGAAMASPVINGLYDGNGGDDTAEYSFNYSGVATAVPEPSPLILGLAGSICLGLLYRRCPRPLSVLPGN